jgi:cysteinyl-tRNA synthetase
MAYRLLLLGGHYRHQLTYSRSGITAAQSTVRRLTARITELGPLPPVATYADTLAGLPADDRTAHELLARLDRAVAADLNTPQALAVLHEVVRSPRISDDSRRVLVASVCALTGLELRADTVAPVDRARIEELVQHRDRARAARDWARADALRAELAAYNVRITDTANGATWEFADAGRR